MKKELSALLDGEIEQHETPALWSALKADGRLADKLGRVSVDRRCAAR